MTRVTQRQLIWIGAGLVLIFAVSQWLIRPVLGRRQQLASNIQRSEKRLQELVRMEGIYRKMRAENARLEKNLRGRQQDFTLFAFLESLAGRDGIKEQIEFMRPSVKELSDTFQEEQVEMRLKDVSLKQLVPYLYHIETAPEQVRIRRLTIRPQQRKESLLEVNLVVVTRKASRTPRVVGGKSARSLLQLGV
jgi:general secretion pathway protein M